MMSKFQKSFNKSIFDAFNEIIESYRPFNLSIFKDLVVLPEDIYQFANAIYIFETCCNKLINIWEHGVGFFTDF